MSFGMSSASSSSSSLAATVIWTPSSSSCMPLALDREGEPSPSISRPRKSKILVTYPIYPDGIDQFNHSDQRQRVSPPLTTSNSIHLPLHIHIIRPEYKYLFNDYRPTDPPHEPKAVNAVPGVFLQQLWYLIMTKHGYPLSSTNFLSPLTDDHGNYDDDDDDNFDGENSHTSPSPLTVFRTTLRTVANHTAHFLAIFCESGPHTAAEVLSASHIVRKSIMNPMRSIEMLASGDAVELAQATGSPAAHTGPLQVRTRTMERWVALNGRHGVDVLLAYVVQLFREFATTTTTTTTTRPTLQPRLSDVWHDAAVLKALPACPVTVASAHEFMRFLEQTSRLQRLTGEWQMLVDERVLRAVAALCGDDYKGWIHRDYRQLGLRRLGVLRLGLPERDLPPLEAQRMGLGLNRSISEGRIQQRDSTASDDKRRKQKSWERDARVRRQIRYYSDFLEKSKLRQSKPQVTGNNLQQMVENDDHSQTENQSNQIERWLDAVSPELEMEKDEYMK